MGAVEDKDMKELSESRLELGENSHGGSSGQAESRRHTSPVLSKHCE